MAKKAKTKKPAKPARTAGKHKSVARKRQPRAQVLAGMEDARIPDLDDVCDDIANKREAINEMKAEEFALQQKGLRLLVENDKRSWRYSGIEIDITPGEDRLVVRRYKEKAATKAASADTGNGE